MTWIYVLCGILIFFIWLFTRRIHIEVGFVDKPFAVFRFLFLKLSLPLEKSVEEQKEAAKKDGHIKKGTAKDKKEKKAKEPLPKKTISEYIEIFTDALKDIVLKLKKYLYLEKYILKANIATDDAAKTAIIYGTVSGAAGTLWKLISSIKRRTKKPGRIYSEVTPDFISETMDFYADIAISIRIWQILALGTTALQVYKKLKKNNVR